MLYEEKRDVDLGQDGHQMLDPRVRLEQHGSNGHLHRSARGDHIRDLGKFRIQRLLGPRNHKRLSTIDKAKTEATGWQHEELAKSGTIYFNQEKDGDMDNAVSVQEITPQ
jgi:hypothetical protein